MANEHLDQLAEDLFNDQENLALNEKYTLLEAIDRVYVLKKLVSYSRYYVKEVDTES